MNTLVSVNVQIVEEGEEGTIITDLSAPNIDMAIEKMGAFERAREKNKVEEKEEDKEGNPTECMCRKCGIGLRCQHDSDMIHIQSLCGNCA